MSRYAKAIVGAILTFAGALAAALPDGLTTQEISTAVAALLVALVGIWWVPNKPATPPAEGAHRHD